VDQYTPGPDLLAGRTILVTGAGDGIGRAAALALANHQATVILLGRTANKLERVYDQIEQAGKPRPAIVTLDLSRTTGQDYEKLAKTIADEFGHLDGLLHNAAELGTLTPLALYDLDTWSKVFAVNVHAALLLTRACLPALSKSNDASIVFTSADVGRRGRAYWGAYGVTCFAANTSIRVNSLDPGPVKTAMRTRAYPGEDTEHLPEAESIMASYLYLMGPDSRGITGQALSAQPR
jgi:NAD(P)-dependent dehydrogenase (short-subunit alcohol dehydrogenase family)